MDTSNLKPIVARHFDYATPGTGQYLNGDWFTPKHKDSLGDLLEELEFTWESAEHDKMQRAVIRAEEEVESLRAKIAAAENELA